jgi:hypothetical protein
VTAAELQGVLDAHGRWLRDEEGGIRANLAGADLARANLADANLAGADLARANLARANLARANLAGANLAGANLARANLAGANLAGAYLADANLAGADLARANLARADLARADLAGANLAGANLAGANLADADLADADLAGADLADADLAGAIGLPATLSATPASEPPQTREPWRRRSPEEIAERYRQSHPEVPVLPDLDTRMAEVCSVPGALEMGRWHSCETTHCRAGWAITLAGEVGKKLEEEHGPRRAGAMIYRASTGRVPHFFASNEAALKDIQECAAMAAGKVTP